MKSDAKSSITLPPEEVKLVRQLKARLKLKSNVEVVRAGLRLLRETSEREALREQFRTASQAVRAATEAELEELDHLSAEGLD
jgi:Arc/MetJ-type ribon-helix-helix transcriptional regulator